MSCPHEGNTELSTYPENYVYVIILSLNPRYESDYILYNKQCSMYNHVSLRISKINSYIPQNLKCRIYLKTQTWLALDNDRGSKVKKHSKRLRNTGNFDRKPAISTCALCNAVNWLAKLLFSCVYATSENIRADILILESILQRANAKTLNKSEVMRD